NHHHTSQTGNQPEEGTRRAERQQVNNLHATTPQRKSKRTRTQGIGITARFPRRVANSLFALF
ncbi:hypothetical protein, partial [Bifidobacterium longum]|uniref:hypothetical protein n=1 Tax=Bifidobacterium longum TaxID=216816 RepID=UPI001A9032B0